MACTNHMTYHTTHTQCKTISAMRLRNDATMHAWEWTTKGMYLAYSTPNRYTPCTAPSSSHFSESPDSAAVAAALGSIWMTMQSTRASVIAPVKVATSGRSNSWLRLLPDRAVAGGRPAGCRGATRGRMSTGTNAISVPSVQNELAKSLCTAALIQDSYGCVVCDAKTYIYIYIYIYIYKSTYTQTHSWTIPTYSQRSIIGACAPIHVLTTMPHTSAMCTIHRTMIWLMYVAHVHETLVSHLRVHDIDLIRWICWVWAAWCTPVVRMVQ